MIIFLQVTKLKLTQKFNLAFVLIRLIKSFAIETHYTMVMLLIRPLDHVLKGHLMLSDFTLWKM